MSEKTEADEIEELIEKYVICRIRLYQDWSSENMYEVHAKKQALQFGIRSIISERDALRAAMQSHRKELR